jgi:hypothetical protein
VTKQLAATPSSWNDHFGPLLLRTITELHVTIAWLRLNPANRARRFVAGSVHAVQCELAQRIRELGSRAPIDDERTMIDGQERWIAEQVTILCGFGVAISPLPALRQLAEEAGCLGFYRSVHAPLDACARSLWHQIEGQRGIALPGADISYLLMASRYWNMTIQLFGATSETGATGPSSREQLISAVSGVVDLSLSR